MLAPRIVEEEDEGDLRNVAKVNFDPSVRDWLPEEEKKEAEIVL
jgi:hypothetical protein